ncbi:RNA ligase family protein [Serpentinicella sp. ANB-PHB4]|uniref:ATP-dependent DNA ligase n=1 Tax=Serpentinicella sp. ANB-PHB4 TaxID=3074076 RepID=UPI0028557033|nr:RNA ligase family protein [Serpentinicella sp. ANB-PHB4]MDR5659038.1 RNA ligase family protein [Serpentinicella sp. ANB-PHB4]
MFFPLMLLETAKNPFSSEQFIFEPKFDGIRLEYSNIDKPMLYTRNGNIVNKPFAELLTPYNKKIILDGEVVCFDENAQKENFELVMKRFRLKNESKINLYEKKYPVTYMVFDILYFDGKDLRDMPLADRKSILDGLDIASDFMKKINYIKKDGLAYFMTAQSNNLEGIVAKNINSSYVGSRNRNWLKIINWIETDAIIVGYRKSDYSILCAHLDSRPLGLVLHGMTSVQKEAFLKLSKKLKNHEDSQYVYIDPHLNCRLKGRGFTSKGILRSPIFIDFIY